MADIVDTEILLLWRLVQDVQTLQATPMCTCPSCAPRTAAQTLVHVLTVLHQADEQTLDYWGLDHSQEGYGLLATVASKEYDL